MRPVFTGSGAERALACPASEALPRVLGVQTEQATKGTAQHRYLELVGQVGHEAAAEEVGKDVDALTLDALREQVPNLPTHLEGEVPMAYDYKTGRGRRLENAKGRRYSGLSATEVPLTLDVLGLLPNGSIFVADYKSGDDVTPAARNVQLAIGALAACGAYSRGEATVEIIYLRDGRIRHRDEAKLEEFDLDAAAERIATGAKAVLAARELVAAGKTPDVTVGPHCKYCPAFANCPGQLGLVRDLMRDPEIVPVAAIHPDNAAHVYQRYQAAKRALAHVGEALYAFGLRQGIVLPDGKVYGAVSKRVERIDGAGAFELLKQRFGLEIATAACEMETSKTAIKRAIAPAAKAEGKSVSALEREVHGMLREKGAIESKTRVEVREHAAGRDSEDAA